MAPGSAASPMPTPELIAYSNAQNLITEVATLFSFAAITVILRCYVRIVILKSFGHDDLTMFISMLMAAATLICYVLQIPYGLGKHLSVIQMDPVKYEKLLKIRYVHQIICGPAVTVVKISVAFSLLRLVNRRAYRWFLYGLIIFLIAFLLTCAGTLGKNLQIWACIPVAASWNYSLRPPPLGHGTAKCFTKETFGQIALFNAVVNCATDFLLALLPVPLIWKLKLNVRTRISLILILSLGVFAGVAGTIRASVFNTILKDPRRFIHDKYSMWNYVELTVGIIAGSLPALKPLFVRFLNVARGTSAAESGRPSRHATPNALGYLKQGEKSRSGVVFSEYKVGKKGPAAANNGSIWSTVRGNESGDSMVPLQRLDVRPHANSIVITKGFCVEQRDV